MVYRIFPLISHFCLCHLLALFIDDFGTCLIVSSSVHSFIFPQDFHNHIDDLSRFSQLHIYCTQLSLNIKSGACPWQLCSVQGHFTTGHFRLQTSNLHSEKTTPYIFPFSILIPSSPNFSADVFSFFTKKMDLVGQEQC